MSKNPFESDASGTYCNWSGSPSTDLTLDELVETAAKLKAILPIENDMTVAPDLASKARALVQEHSGTTAWAVRVWVDETLPAGTWHKGKPVREQLRTALLPPLPIFPEPFRPRFYTR